MNEKTTHCLYPDPNLCTDRDLDLFILVAQTTHAPPTSSYSGGETEKQEFEGLTTWKPEDRSKLILRGTLSSVLLRSHERSFGSYYRRNGEVKRAKGGAV
jgi:hypothetical protein